VEQKAIEERISFLLTLLGSDSPKLPITVRLSTPEVSGTLALVEGELRLRVLMKVSPPFRVSEDGLENWSLKSVARLVVIGWGSLTSDFLVPALLPLPEQGMGGD
jgi:hypothetical protein